DDLKELLLVGLQVGEKPYLLEDLEGEVLGLVYDEHDVAPPPDPLKEDPVHLRDQVHLATGKFRLAELVEDRLEHLGLRDARVQDEGGVKASRVELVQEAPAER